jgi:xanthine/uracil permease
MEQRNILNEAVLGAQMLFVAFGALVLVPLLTGLNPSIALFTAGLALDRGINNKDVSQNNEEKSK